jgi:hypothetical protein
MLRTVDKIRQNIHQLRFRHKKRIGLIRNQDETSTRFWFLGLHFSIDIYSLREKNR